MNRPGEKTTTDGPAPTDYTAVLSGVVDLVDVARRASAGVVNSLMTATYWEIGRRLVEHEQAGHKRAEYGEELQERQSHDHLEKFGRGFGVIQLRTMRQSYQTHPMPQPLAIKPDIRQSVIDEYSQHSGSGFSRLGERLREIARNFTLPWTHYVRLLRVKNPLACEFYAREALAGGWSVRQLDRRINSPFYERTALSKDKASIRIYSVCTIERTSLLWANVK